MLEVQLYELGHCDESEYTRVVCVSKKKGHTKYNIFLQMFTSFDKIFTVKKN